MSACPGYGCGGTTRAFPHLPECDCSWEREPEESLREPSGCVACGRGQAGDVHTCKAGDPLPDAKSSAAQAIKDWYDRAMELERERDDARATMSHFSEQWRIAQERAEAAEAERDILRTALEQIDFKANMGLRLGNDKLHELKAIRAWTRKTLGWDDA